MNLADEGKASLSDFDRSVFVNCPFDRGYIKRLLRPMMFTIYHLNFLPKLALDRANSGESRIGKIVEILQQCRYGIHDLSRCVAKAKGEYYRMNMPFELGLDYACTLFKAGECQHKKMLILETKAHRFKAALSDLSGSEIRAHGDNQAKIIEIVRSWLVQEANAPRSATVARIHLDYLEFITSCHERLGEKALDNLSSYELGKEMTEWLSDNWL